VLLRFLNLLTGLYLRLLGARRRILEVGEISLVYYAIGPADGEPWVLLHGLGSVAAMWSPEMRRLRRSCRVLVPELSILGGTRCPGDGLAIAPALPVLAALLDRELPGRPVTLAGLSLGGWMAVRFALRYPERIARLVLIDAGGYRRQNWQRIQKLVTVDDRAGVDRLYRAMFVHVPLLLRLSRAAFLRVYSSPAVRNVLAGLAETDTFTDADLARLRLPAVVIWGEKDGLFTAATGRRIAAAIPGARLEILSGCGHAPHLEQPRALLAAIERFRRETTAARPV
jgi:pimeloyl-ACP methyl ester carboxylesterase